MNVSTCLHIAIWKLFTLWIFCSLIGMILGAKITRYFLRR